MSVPWTDRTLASTVKDHVSGAGTYKQGYCKNHSSVGECEVVVFMMYDMYGAV